MVIFRRKPVQSAWKSSEVRGVSIVIANKNDSKHLIKNLPYILLQEYPLFEIIIVDDNSNERELNALNEFIDNEANIKLIASEGIGKKMALTTGIDNASYQMILCTDADCTPASNQWISKMVQSAKSNNVVLGFSPYNKRKGWLNLLIRFETLMTAIQYMSWTLSGKPYMAVGRNMMYPKHLFLNKKPYDTNMHVPYGDDDLLVQAVSSSAQIVICADSDAHVISAPALSWNEWLKQKHRHLSAAYYYEKSLWLLPGIYGIAMVLHWTLLPLLIIAIIWTKWLPVLIIGILIRWINYSSWVKKLGSRDTMLWYPFLEISYAVYLGAIGIYTLAQKKKTWN